MTGTRLRAATVVAVILASAGLGFFASGGGAQEAPLAARDQQRARVQWDKVQYVPPSRRFTAVLFDPRSQFPKTSIGDLDRTTLPILLPDGTTGVDLSGLNLSSEGDVYDIRLPQSTPGLRVLLSGSRVFVPVEPGTLSRQKFDRVVIGGEVVPALFNRTEDGWLASFSRFGMSYTVEVICDLGPAENYCKDDSYARKVTSGMTQVVLGQAGLADLDQNGEK